MKSFGGMAFLSLVLLLCGCSSVETAAHFNSLKAGEGNSTAIAAVHSQIYGYYIFGLPVISGSAVTSGKSAMFKDTVLADNALFLASYAAKELGATQLQNIVVSKESEWIPWTLIFFAREVNVSAVAAQ